MSETQSISGFPTMDRQSDQMTDQTQTIDWYAPGESQVVVIGDQEIHIRNVGRKGRRSRIAIMAPAGATFVKQPVGPQTAAEAPPEPNGGTHAGDA